MKIVVEIHAESGSHGGLTEIVGYALLDTRDNSLSSHVYDEYMDAVDSADLANTD